MGFCWRSPLFWTILAVYLLAGVLFVTLTPAWQAPDEPAHYNYVHYLATQGSFPVLVAGCYDQPYLQTLTSHRFAPELSIEPLCYESHQPPLYYLLAAPLFWVSQGSLTALRLLSVALGAGVSTLAFIIGWMIFPYRPAIAYGAMAFVAFVPMHLTMMASVNSDTLAELIFAGLLLLLTRRLLADSPASLRGDVGLGLLLGLGLLTKTTIYVALILVAVTLWLEAARQPGGLDWPKLARRALVVFGVALLLILPWYSRNAALYGPFDILGLARHDEVVVGQLRAADFIAQVGRRVYLKDFALTTFHSFWGQFGWMAVPMNERVYQLLGLLTLIAAAGLVGGAIDRLLKYKSLSAINLSAYRSASPRRLALGLMGLTVGLVVLAYIGYNVQFVQFQGRYLFPALIPAGLFFTLGLSEAFSTSRAWWLAGGLGLILAAVVLAGVKTGDLDKWAALIAGLAFLLAIARAWWRQRWPIPAEWLLAVVYTGLAGLALVSPFWFIVPHLSP